MFVSEAGDQIRRLQLSFVITDSIVELLIYEIQKIQFCIIQKIPIIVMIFQWTKHIALYPQTLKCQVNNYK